MEKNRGVVNGIIKVLNSVGMTYGNLLDLCCGNGRISVHMAKKGFKAVGIDISRTFIEDAKRKARQHGVSGKTTFLDGDVRKLKDVLKDFPQKFDVVVNAWTSIGYFPREEELRIFKQARHLSNEDAILFIIETVHTEFFSLKFTPTDYSEIDSFLILENRGYDPKTSQLSTTWTFYEKYGNDLKFVDKIEFQLHIYSLSELVELLEKAGWETTAYHGNLSNLQPMTPTNKPKHSRQSSIINSIPASDMKALIMDCYTHCSPINLFPRSWCSLHGIFCLCHYRKV